MATFKTTIELEVDVEYTATKGMKGSRDKYGVPETPDDDDELVIESVEVRGAVGLKFGDLSSLLTAKQLDSLVQEGWEHCAE